MAITSLKMGNQEFEIFFESGFSDGNHCLNGHAVESLLANSQVSIIAKKVAELIRTHPRKT